MTFNTLVPWKWGRKSLPVRREDEVPFFTLQREMNRLFEEFFPTMAGTAWREPAGTELFEPLSAFTPQIDVTETDKEIRITAELPGMDEKDVDVSLTKEMLTISGEKKFEKEEDVKGYHRVERSYGSFRRVIPLPCEINADKVEATYKGGVLTIVMPKAASVQEALKTIPVRHG